MARRRAGFGENMSRQGGRSAAGSVQGGDRGRDCMVRPMGGSEARPLRASAAASSARASRRAASSAAALCRGCSTVLPSTALPMSGEGAAIAATCCAQHASAALRGASPAVTARARRAAERRASVRVGVACAGELSPRPSALLACVSDHADSKAQAEVRGTVRGTVRAGGLPASLNNALRLTRACTGGVADHDSGLLRRMACGGSRRK